MGVAKRTQKPQLTPVTRGRIPHKGDCFQDDHLGHRLWVVPETLSQVKGNGEEHVGQGRRTAWSLERKAPLNTEKHLKPGGPPGGATVWFLEGEKLPSICRDVMSSLGSRHFPKATMT